MKLPPDKAIGLVSIALLFAVAIFYTEARTTFVDIAFHLFEQATTGKVAIQNYRFVSGLSQVVPTYLINHGASMATVQLAYSLVFPLLYAGTWALLYFVMRARAWALGWALTWLAFATHVHFWIQSELPQGLAVLTLAMALVGCEPRARWAQVLAKAALPLLLFTAAFAHPLLVVPASFGFGLIALLQVRNSDIVWSTAGAAGLYFSFYWVRSTFFSTSYDEAAGQDLEVMITGLLGGDVPYAITHLLHNLVLVYYAFVLVAALGVYFLWRSGAKLAAAWSTAAVVGHLLLVALSYPTDYTVDFYIENLYLPAGWMAGVAFAFGWQRVNGYAAPAYAVAGVAVLGLIRVVHILYFGQTLYQPRLDFLEEELATYREQKVFRVETPELTERLIMTWGTPYEAWVISAREGRPTQGYIVHVDQNAYRWALDDAGRCVMTFTQPIFDELREDLFANPDSSATYVVVP